jgi:hypothetical protein
MEPGKINVAGAVRILGLAGMEAMNFRAIFFKFLSALRIRDLGGIKLKI